MIRRVTVDLDRGTLDLNRSIAPDVITVVSTVAQANPVPGGLVMFMERKEGRATGVGSRE